jgi:hypothetical protein
MNTPLKISVVSSSTGDPVMVIPFNKLRRFGCQIAIGSDIVWFETCSCHGDMEEFQFFTVALGIEKAYQIVQEYKRTIELALRDHLIMEEGDQSQFLYSYVLKSHYGHPDYPTVGRERILQSGIMSLSTSGGSLSLSELNKFARSRSSVPTVINAPPGPVPGDMGQMRSPSPSPVHSPTSHDKKMSILQCGPRPSRTSQTSTDFDSGVNMDSLDPNAHLDPSRHSAPCYFPAMSAGGKKSSKATLEAMRKGKSFDEKPSPPTQHRTTLKDFKATSVDSRTTRKTSLADLQVKGVSPYSRSPLAQRRDGYDSAVGSASDLPHSPPGNIGSPARGVGRSPYDHLGTSSNSTHSNGRSPYDHLDGMAGMSLNASYGGKSSNSYGRKRNGPAYVET